MRLICLDFLEREREKERKRERERERERERQRQRETAIDTMNGKLIENVNSTTW